MTDCDCQVTLDSRLSTQSRPRDCTASVVRRSSRLSLSPAGTPHAHSRRGRTPRTTHRAPLHTDAGETRERSSRCLSATSSACQRLSCHDLACHRSAHHHAPWHALLQDSTRGTRPVHLHAIFAPSRTHKALRHLSQSLHRRRCRLPAPPRLPHCRAHHVSALCIGVRSPFRDPSYLRAIPPLLVTPPLPPPCPPQRPPSEAAPVRRDGRRDHVSTRRGHRHLPQQLGQLLLAPVTRLVAPRARRSEQVP